MAYGVLSGDTLTLLRALTSIRARRRSQIGGTVEATTRRLHLQIVRKNKIVHFSLYSQNIM